MSRIERDDDREIVIHEVGGGFGTFFAGLALGAIVTLLVAPQSGAETRRAISTRAERVRKRASRAMEDLGETVRERYHDAREYVQEEVETAREVIDNKKRQVDRAVEVGREAMRETRENLQRKVSETRAEFASDDAERKAAASGRRGGDRISD
jgi:gas vesicle protein